MQRGKGGEGRVVERQEHLCAPRQVVLLFQVRADGNIEYGRPTSAYCTQRNIRPQIQSRVDAALQTSTCPTTPCTDPAGLSLSAGTMSFELWANSLPPSLAFNLSSSSSSSFIYFYFPPLHSTSLLHPAPSRLPPPFLLFLPLASEITALLTGLVDLHS